MSISIELHPLAVLNISDHLTRATYMEKGQNIRVIGALLGKQEGRTLEIVNTVELAFREVSDEDGGIKIDEGFCTQRLEAYKKLFTDLECLGFYTSSKSDSLNQADALIAKKFQKFAENPLVIAYNPNSKEANDKGSIPFFLYELSPVGNAFIKLDFSLASSDSERIAVDHVAKAIDTNQKTSALS